LKTGTSRPDPAHSRRDHRRPRRRGPRSGRPGPGQAGRPGPPPPARRGHRHLAPHRRGHPSGLPTRIGLEDVLHDPDGHPITTNADLIRLALARE